jgi:glycosyltransferase involved in cell wall biosynthesis
LKVLHFYKTYLPNTIGGIEQVINQIARGTASLGVTTEVLSLSSKKVERTVTVDGHLVHRCHSNFELASTPFSVTAFYRFSELAKEADIIHYHFPYPFADILDLLKGVKKPTVITYHSDIVKQKTLLKLYSPLMNSFLGRADHIVATSPNYLATSKVLTSYKDKVSVIPIGLDENSYPNPTPDRLNHWEEQFGSRFFLFLGVLRYYKGLHVLIEAAKDCEYPIVIVGAGPIEVQLKMQVEKAGIKNIHFVGFVSEEDKVSLLTLCYALVFPSHLRSEAFGVSLLEGAMYGKPLISSEIGTGTTFINMDGETGLVVPPSDPLALRQAMQTLWQEPSKAKLMGQKARSRYLNIFTAKDMAKAYVDIYQKLLDI